MAHCVTHAVHLQDRVFTMSLGRCWCDMEALHVGRKSLICAVHSTISSAAVTTTGTRPAC